MGKDKQPTIKEIARQLNISTSTVSRALNDHPSIGLVTTMRVKKLAEELHYEPNRTAIFFKQGRTFTIGVVLPSLSEAFFSAAISEIENMANGKNYTVILGQSLDDPEREGRIINTMKDHRVDGIILSAAKNATAFGYIDVLKQAGIPLVFFDCVPDVEHIYAIVSNLKTGMFQAIDTFVSCGHHKIAFLNGPKQLAASREREEAFIAALQAKELKIDREYIVYTDLSEKGNELAMRKLLNLSDRPSAIVSFNDYVTLDAMNAVRQKGLVINQDIYFISYANYPIWRYMENPPMATIEQFPDQQGILAAQMLFELIEQQDHPKSAEEYEAKGRRIVLDATLLKKHI